MIFHWKSIRALEIGNIIPGFHMKKKRRLIEVKRVAHGLYFHDTFLSQEI